MSRFTPEEVSDLLEQVREGHRKNGCSPIQADLEALKELLDANGTDWQGLARSHKLRVRVHITGTLPQYVAFYRTAGELLGVAPESLCPSSLLFTRALQGKPLIEEDEHDV